VAELRAGDYQLIRRIAMGGMGEVYLARRTTAADFTKRVAVKLLLPHLCEEPELVQRFLEEARLSALMHHPNIVEIFDLGETEGRPFIVMQAVEGLSLAQLLSQAQKTGETLPLPLVRLVITGVCEALAYAHALRAPSGEALGIIHRDVTPSNILLSAAGAVLLMDFGIAKAHGARVVTEPGKVRGKATWLAPEQALLRPVDHRADLYSAGLTFYSALAGDNPFRRNTDVEVLHAVVAAERPAPISALRGDVTADMSRALARALAYAPDDRFPDARAMREALVDGPVATAPELGQWVQRFGGDALERLRDTLPGEQPQGTSSLGGSTTQTTTEPQLPVRRRRWPMLAAAAGVLALGLAVGGLLRREAPPGRVAPPPRQASPAPKAEDAIPEEPEVELEPNAPAQPHKSHPRPALAVGYVTADADPWANVLENGRVLERTPFARFPLPPGRHTLVFQGPNGVERSRAVRVEPGRETTLRVDMKQP
jgi:serine/threonine protein kinase